MIVRSILIDIQSSYGGLLVYLSTIGIGPALAVWKGFKACLPQ
jgi:hypothetical protein